MAQDSRIRIKRSTNTGDVPTVAPSTDHTDGTWDALDLYVGELFVNTVDDTMYVRTDNGVRQIGMFNPSDPCHCVHVAKLTLTSAQVQRGYTTPIQFGITVPSGYYIKPLGCDVKIDYQTTPYATNTNLRIRAVGALAADYIAGINGLLGASANTFAAMSMLNGAAGSVNFIVGVDFEVFVPTGNPTAGDSPVTLYLTYILIEA